MTRILTWLLGTAAAVALLFGYHTSTAGSLAATTETAAVAPPTAGTTGTAGTVTGSVAQTRWGPVQVQITVQDGRITAVTVPQYPDGNGRDREINDVALPELVQETLSAQSADIDMVSGATVTSEGYLESLQSALDQVGL
jgi:uncharacterized protein with FMN-binding domain